MKWGKGGNFCRKYFQNWLKKAKEKSSCSTCLSLVQYSSQFRFLQNPLMKWHLPNRKYKNHKKRNFENNWSADYSRTLGFASTRWSFPNHISHKNYFSVLQMKTSRRTIEFASSENMCVHETNQKLSFHFRKQTEKSIKIYFFECSNDNNNLSGSPRTLIPPPNKCKYGKFSTNHK